MENRMVFRFMVGLLLVLAMVGIGYYAYSAGVAHGIAESAHASAAGAPLMGWPRWGYGYGFGFFPFFPVFFFVLLWIVLLRGLFWRGRHWGGGGCGRRFGDGVPPQFEEWHRRAHGQGGSQPSANISKA